MNHFYNGTVRNLVVAMSTLFNSIEIKRYDDTGAVAKSISVPLKFGPLSKYYMRRMEDGSLKRYYMQVPTMALTIGGFSYAQDRTVSSKETRALIDPANYDNPEAFLSDLMPTPWDINFTLGIRTESFTDFLQIIEQIVPFFNPSVYLSVKEFNTINLERNIRVNLNSLSPEFSEDVEEDGVRTINGSLDFTAFAWFYRPLSDANMIRKITTKYGFDPRNNMFEYYGTSGLTIAETSAIETSGTVITGTWDPSFEQMTSATSATNQFGYVNRMLDGV